MIDQLPVRFTYDGAGKQCVAISQLADQFIKTRGAGQQGATLEIYRKAKRNLIDCLGDVDVTTIRPKDAREFWRWLVEEGSSNVKEGQIRGLATNTAKQRLRFARAFFEQAVED